ncbi:hypothetical protein OL548_11850 [Lysinibacillus sp. MHQ-1]|nr:hypothetical protein OL548_11850 [Lysinibacillus sp. MHQ-1]
MFSEDYQRYIRFIHINTVQQQTVVLGFRFDEWLIKGEPSQVKSNEYIVLTKKSKKIFHIAQQQFYIFQRFQITHRGGELLLLRLLASLKKILE